MGSRRGTPDCLTRVWTPSRNALRWVFCTPLIGRPSDHPRLSCQPSGTVVWPRVCQRHLLTDNTTAFAVQGIDSSLFVGSLEQTGLTFSFGSSVGSSTISFSRVELTLFVDSYKALNINSATSLCRRTSSLCAKACSRPWPSTRWLKGSITIPLGNNSAKEQFRDV